MRDYDRFVPEALVFTDVPDRDLDDGDQAICVAEIGYGRSRQPLIIANEGAVNFQARERAGMLMELVRQGSDDDHEIDERCFSAIREAIRREAGHHLTAAVARGAPVFVKTIKVQYTRSPDEPISAAKFRGDLYYWRDAKDGSVDAAVVFCERLRGMRGESVIQLLKRNRDDPCPVCFETMLPGNASERMIRTSSPDDGTVDGAAVTTRCNHRFHDVCLTRWCQENDKCPLCRADLFA